MSSIRLLAAPVVPRFVGLFVELVPFPLKVREAKPGYGWGPLMPSRLLPFKPNPPGGSLGTPCDQRTRENPARNSLTMLGEKV